MRGLAGTLAALSAFFSIWAFDVGPFPPLPIYLLLGSSGLLLLVFASLLRRRVFFPTLLDLAVLSYCVWIVFSIVWSVDKSQSLSSAYYSLCSFGLFFLVSRLAEDPKWWARIGWSLIGGAAIASAVVIKNGLGMGTEGDLGERASMRELNPNFVAYSIATTIPVSLALGSLATRSVVARTLSVAFSILAGSAVLFTGSRGSAVAMIATITSFIVIRFRHRFIGLAVALTGIPMALLALYLYLPDAVKQRLALSLLLGGGDISAVNLTGREEVWPYAIETFISHPLTGIGIGAFPTSNPAQIAAHNVLLSVGAETGIVGLTLYLGIIGMILPRLVACRYSPAMRFAGVGLLITWLIISMTGVWEHASVAWIAFGLMITGFRIAPIGPRSRVRVE